VAGSRLARPPGALLWAVVRPRADLVAENLALRQQLGVLRRTVERPRVTDRDRVFWLAMRRLHAGWEGALTIVSPTTVVKWHRKGWTTYWYWRSRPKPGRPSIGWPLVRLIKRLSRENRTWGARRIHDELELLGHRVGVETVRRYMLRRPKPWSGQGWKTFLRNHLGGTAACDFFSVPTATFRNLFVFVVLSHNRRRIRHVAVTAHPTSTWVVTQLEQAFPAEERPEFLVHDRDQVFRSTAFRAELQRMGIGDKPTARLQCWMNAYCERVIETLRHDCTDHVIAWNEQHLERLLREYVAWYNAHRTHFALGGNAPVPRVREVTPTAEVVAKSVLGGLHHRYRAVA
jgi:putative transposase